MLCLDVSMRYKKEKKKKKKKSGLNNDQSFTCSTQAYKLSGSWLYPPS